MKKEDLKGNYIDIRDLTDTQKYKLEAKLFEMGFTWYEHHNKEFRKNYVYVYIYSDGDMICRRKINNKNKISKYSDIVPDNLSLKEKFQNKSLNIENISEEDFKRVQEVLFEAGFKWWGEGKKIQNKNYVFEWKSLYDISFDSIHINRGGKQNPTITLKQIIGKPEVIDLRETYIDTSELTQEQFNQLQEKLFSMGYKWVYSDKRCINHHNTIGIDYSNIMSNDDPSYFIEKNYKEIKVNQIINLNLKEDDKGKITKLERINFRVERAEPREGNIIRSRKRQDKYIFRSCQDEGSIIKG